MGPLIVQHVHQPMGEHQNHAHDVVGHGDGVGAGCVGQNHVAGHEGGIAPHQRVESRPDEVAPAQLPGRLEDGRGDGPEQDLGVGDLPDLIGLGRRLTEVD